MRKSDQFRVAGAQAAAVCFLINAGMSRSNQQACREQSEQACVCLQLRWSSRAYKKSR